MIKGVKIKELIVHKDQRGDFREILRTDKGLMSEIKQVSIGKTFPGIIKAFHWHKHQDDLIYVIRGDIQLVLYDQRRDSITKGETQIIFLGESCNPQLVFIPRGVLHGYKVLKDKEAEVIYIMNNIYNNECPDEGRVPHDDFNIGFDWNK